MTSQSITDSLLWQIKAAVVFWSRTSIFILLFKTESFLLLSHLSLYSYFFFLAYLAVIIAVLVVKRALLLNVTAVYSHIGVHTHVMCKVGEKIVFIFYYVSKYRNLEENTLTCISLNVPLTVQFFLA